MTPNPSDIVAAGIVAITVVTAVASIPSRKYVVDEDSSNEVELSGHNLAEEERNFHKQVALNKAAFKKGIV